MGKLLILILQNVVHSLVFINIINNLTLKLRNKYHSNPYIQGATVPCDTCAYSVIVYFCARHYAHA